MRDHAVVSQRIEVSGVNFFNTTDFNKQYLEYVSPSILRPPMGLGKCGLILQVVLN